MAHRPNDGRWFWLPNVLANLSRERLGIKEEWPAEQVMLRSVVRAAV